MYRPASVQLCRKKGRSGSFWFRLTWIVGYLGLGVAVMFSTLLFPVLLSIFRSHAIHAEPYKLQKLGRVDGLGWTQEVLPHLSRTAQSEDRKELLDLNKLWKPAPNQGFEPCVSPRKSYTRYNISRGYLVVHANGGLNQMRAGICDMVAVARLINATLVIPELDKRSFWQDTSNFSNVFDEEYFIKALENDLPVVRKLPKELLSAPKAHKQFRSWSSVKYYQEDIVQLWENYKIIRASKSDSRLANNNLPSDIQKLRCRVHYDALRFAPPIEALGKKLLERMRSDGPFIALHLRYEKDMLAFSGCTYGLSDPEIAELTMIRENTPHWKVKLINATEQRIKGFCPLTPKEVGIFLQAFGYPTSTRIYIAAGEIYGGNGSMTELRARFPNLMCKETIATSEELAPFSGYASQMAALDYIVSVESDVFVPSYSGNMARAVEGHRRFLGHRKTIIPDRRRLVGLFDQLDLGLLQEGDEFSSLVVKMHSKRQGAPRKRKGPLPGTKGRERLRTEEAFYTNPLPDCLCQKKSVTLDAKRLTTRPRGDRNASSSSNGGNEMERPRSYLQGFAQIR
eukprot:c24286_g1_i2 orf=271-1974(-)